jgi:L-ascorbate metabolism protein UlaG (beta-lactamase superfamily)
LASLVSKITRYDQSGVRIDNNGQIIYIDPVYLPAEVTADADVILITHGHEDHFSPTALNKLKKSTTIFVVTGDIYSQTVAIADADRVMKIAPDSVLNLSGTQVEVVKAYNSNHTLPNSVGYILTIDGKKVYHTGDTKRIPEMTGYTCDLVFLPMGQTYTFATLAEAAGAAEDCGADVVIPMHYGLYEGKVSDPWAMKELLKDKAVVYTMQPVK